ncbi:MAG: DsbA family protein [Gemmatimonadaceae bacterium]
MTQPRVVATFARFLALTAACALIFAVLAGARCGSSEGDDRGSAPDTAAGTPQSSDSIVARADRSRIQGSDSARLWIVEISDFQCPYCAQWHSASYEVVKREYVDAGKARLAYVNFPLPSHKNAWAASEAALCAGLQDRFWPMHDVLFESQQAWKDIVNPSAFFDSLAAGVGVNAPQYRQCVASEVVRPLIQSDLDRSIQSGVNSTPTFIVGSVTVLGAQPLADFRRLLDSLLGSAR